MIRGEQPGLGAIGSGSRTWHALVSFWLALFGFFLPHSTAGTAIPLAALLLLVAVRPRLLKESAPWREPVMAVGLALFAFIALHSLWASGLTRETRQIVNQYHELLFAPFLLPVMRDPGHRQVFFRSFIAGAVVVALAYWTQVAVPSLYAELATKRISAGLVLAIAAFLLFQRAQARGNSLPTRLLAAFFAATVLFAMDGRTGYLVLLLLLSVSAWVQSPPRWRWPAAIGVPVIVAVVAVASGTFDARIKEMAAASERTTLPHEADSTGVRLQLLTTSAELLKKHWLAGAGFANHAKVHEEATRARLAAVPGGDAYAAGWVRSTHPHNEYLMQLLGGGIVALGLFLAWLGLAFREARRAPPELGVQLAGVTLAFAVGSLFNSLLLNFVEGHIYMALLAWLIAGIRQPQPPLAALEPQRILVVATRQIGDVLLTTPLIHAARERWPHSRIDVLGFAGTLGMLRGNPDVHELVEVPALLGSGAWPLARRLWRRYHLALVTDPGDRAHLIGWISSPLRAGIVPHEGGSNWWKRMALDHVVVASGDQGTTHVAVEKQALLAPWVDEKAGAPQVLPPQADPLPADVSSQLRGGYVVVHSPSMWPYKQWPIAYFEQLVRALLARDRQVVLTGSASPRDQECIAALRAIDSAPRLLDVSGKLDFNQLVTLMRGAALYVGPDTSVSHLAAATGVPVIAIFGPTNPMRWAPWPAKAAARELFERSTAVQQAGNVTLLQSQLPCVPCGRAGCEDHRQSRSDCLVEITPERVIERVDRILGRDRGTSGPMQSASLDAGSSPA